MHKNDKLKNKNFQYTKKLQCRNFIIQSLIFHKIDEDKTINKIKTNTLLINRK